MVCIDLVYRTESILSGSPLIDFITTTELILCKACWHFKKSGETGIKSAYSSASLNNTYTRLAVKG